LYNPPAAGKVVGQGAWHTMAGANGLAVGLDDPTTACLKTPFILSIFIKNIDKMKGVFRQNDPAM
jgi:hypothetical protein